MKTLILTCNTGEGHNSTAGAIREVYELNGEYCEICESFSFMSKRLSKLIGKGHATMYRHTPVVFNMGYELSEKHGGAFSSGSMLYKFLTTGIKRFHRHVVTNEIDNIICVHPFAAMMANELCERYHLDINISIVATDYTCAPGTNGSPMDRYFVPHRETVAEFVANGVPKNKITVSGIPIKQCFFVEPNKINARERLSLPMDKKLAVMCCGSMGCGPIEKIGRSLAQQFDSDTMLIIICGSNTHLYNKLSDLKSEKVQVIGYTRQMSDYMEACDLFITKPGGISITEGATLRVPMIFVNAVAGCELRNREFFKRIECARTTEDADGVVSECLSMINDAGCLTKLRENLESEFTMNGAKCIYETLKNN